jgi:hypothetical protein
MKVWELIEALNQVDINKEIYLFYDGDIASLDYVDELSDRIDINIKEINHVS